MAEGRKYISQKIINKKTICLVQMVFSIKNKSKIYFGVTAFIKPPTSKKEPSFETL